MTSTDAGLLGGTAVARIVADRATAMRVADVLGEALDPDDAITAISEITGERWAVEVHFRADPNQRAVRDLVVDAAGRDVAETLAFEMLAARDWVAASLQGLKPVEAGRFVVHGRHDRACVPPNRIGIEIEAALAFGTGHHGTTRGCLLALDYMLKARRPRRVLDLGTGSGVLAIAAARALRQPVLASDIDRAAVRIARANARANRVGTVVEVIRAAGLIGPRFRHRASFDLVLANILLKPLNGLAAPMTRLLAQDARVVLSGLLPAQANTALAAYRAAGLKLERRIEVDGWSTVVLAARATRCKRWQSARRLQPASGGGSCGISARSRRTMA